VAQVIAHQVAEPVDRWLRAGGGPGPARNVNARGEVPDSTWFTSRHRQPPPTNVGAGAAAAATTGAPAAAAATGAPAAAAATEPPPPATSSGPSLLGPWTVGHAGRDEAGPFLVIRDESGHRFALRFDAPAHPRLATTASLVASRLLHRVGYHVPERHLVIFLPAQLRLSDDSRRGGEPLRPPRRKRRLRPRDLRRLLRGLPRLRDGSLRAVATRLEAAVPLGPFGWRSTRPDDPNDAVDHARRRELRGLRPVAAWLNLTRITTEVPQDLFLRSGRHVRHLLWGLRGSLGSTRRGRPKPCWEGFASLLSLRRLLAQAVTLGSLRRRWTGLRRYRRWQLRRWPGLGWLPQRGFDPPRWAPRLSNSAFAAADARDLHWGARRLAAVSPAAVRRIVRAAYLPKAEATRLARVLLTRRRAALRAWLRLRAPLDHVRLDPRTRRLCVTDLWRREGLDDKTRPTYETRIRAGAHLTPRAVRAHQAPGPRASDPSRAGRTAHARLCLALPPAARMRARWGRYLVLSLRRPDVSPHWLRIHLRVETHRVTIAGIER